jgi:hypothetical protein
MSDWHRSFVRSGEKPKPVHPRSVQVPASLAIVPRDPEPPAPPTPGELSEVESRFASVKAQVIKIDVELSKLSGRESGLGSARQTLRNRKAGLMAQIPQLKALVYAEREARSRDSKKLYAKSQADVIARACSIIAVLRSIVMDIDEQGPSETEAIRNAGAFLKEHGHLP